MDLKTERNTISKLMTHVLKSINELIRSLSTVRYSAVHMPECDYNKIQELINMCVCFYCCRDGGGDTGTGIQQQQHQQQQGGERRCGGGGSVARRVPSLRLANGRVAAAQSEEEIRSPPPQPRRLAKDDSIKISIENTNTCTDSLVTALDDETLLIADFLSNSDMNCKGSSGKVCHHHHQQLCLVLLV